VNARPISYDVDAAGTVVRIDGPWDEFAERNGAPRLTRAAVLSRPLLSFVAGRDMCQLVAMLLTRARSGAVVSLGFRCDAPSERRHLLFEAHAADGVVRCRSTLLRTEPRDVPLLLDDGRPRSGETVTVCGWCRRVRVTDGRWLEIEDAVEAEALFDGGPVPALTHGICADCASLLRTGSKRRFGR
jgi:hypothetical protein